MFGEHDLFDHGHCMYHPLLRVPLILRFPGRVAEGKRIAETVSLRDLPATILDLIGIPREQSLPGHSLAALWSGLPGPHVSSPALSEISQRIGGPRDLPASQGDMKSLYVDELHYIQNGDDSEELYDVRADPDELHNLIGTSPAVPRLRAALAEALK
jgi:arylsulfatase A-like enzyme